MRHLAISLRTALAGVAVLLVSIAAGLVISAALSGRGASSASVAAGALPRPGGGGATDFVADAARADPLATGTNVVARARRRSIALYRHAGAAHATRRLAARRLGGHALPLVFLVQERRPGWLRVALPTRPNLSHAWVRSGDVVQSTDHFGVRIELRRHRLLVRAGKHVFLRRRIAVGRALSPTPTGRYFITDLVRPPDPKGFYGPYAFGLSAHSPVYTHFGGGDGQVGLHGTSNPSVLGSDVSHGCIRVDNATITRLARLLPLGTPVMIVH